MSKKLEIKDGFYINNTKTKIVSGAIHYFRVVPEYWEDRIIKLIEMGCNTIETYVPWNLHEPYEGNFCFEGIADLNHFLELCTKHQLNIILRLSPYICAEWEFGGFPGWLLKYDNLRLRSDCAIFLQKVDNFYKKIAPIVGQHLGKNGGNIIMLQVENEYGSFSYDKEYLLKIYNIMVKYGLDYNLFTADGPWDNLMQQGAIPNLALPTGNFGSNAPERFKNQLEFTKNKDLLMCMEFWDGWFDCWGDKKHNTRAAAEATTELEAALKLGSVNLYMFHGGTNFGFWNGSNFKDKLLPRVTSYDYDAPLSEAGERRTKFFAFQNAIKKYLQTPVKKTLSVELNQNFSGSFSNPKNILY
ncbi:hypothetical protein SCLARK_001277 [Spiroplasma clarkii]|uniref:glycoside hydrolase family 35 protein n=1 Tax=Spiroplasma clarkii TaxID=2139 RepID=UPI000B54CF56|nr:beta-galactosidase family protein [Spiroplasma clarkii]ARU91817.1 hypothetical protein SCLARK_001277 [Spiroplasma clarkii]